MSKHTPTPWKAEGGYIFAGEGDEILVCIQSTINDELVADAEANAARIVKCVNLHDELVECLKIAQQKLAVFNRNISPIQVATDEGFNRIRAILAKTKGDA